MRYLWNHPVVIAGVMGMLLLLVTAVSIIAIKAVGDTPAGNGKGSGNQGQPGGTDPTGGTNVVNPGGAAGTTPQSSPAQGGPAVFLSGKLTLAYYDGGIDLDTAKKNVGEDGKADIDVTETALTTLNGAQLAVGAAGAAPAQACAAASLAWGKEAHLSVLNEGAVICAKTNEGRLGALSVTTLSKSSAGQLQSVETQYVIWKKTGDQ